MMGPPKDRWYLRTAHPKFPVPPSLAELEDSPWKYNPRDSISRQSYFGRKFESPPNDLSQISPMVKEAKLVNMEESADLGDLKKYAKDDKMYHLEMYDDGNDDDLIRRKMWRVSRLDESQGKGVFDKGESLYDSRRTNPPLISESLQQRNLKDSQADLVMIKGQSFIIFQNNYREVTAQSPMQEQDEITTLQENSNKMLQIIQLQKKRQNANKAQSYLHARLAHQQQFKLMKQRKMETATSEFIIDPTIYSTSERPVKIPKLLPESPLSEERRKRKTLRALLDQQTEINEALRDENDCLQEQQRALLALLQEKDKQLSVLRKRPGTFQTQETNTVENFDMGKVAVCKIRAVLLGRAYKEFNNLQICLLEGERQRIIEKLEQIKAEGEKERRLMAYQQFEMAMQHFGKYFETMKRKRQLNALSSIFLYSNKRNDTQKMGAYYLVFAIKRIMLNKICKIEKGVTVKDGRLEGAKLIMRSIKGLAKGYFKDFVVILQNVKMNEVRETQTSVIVESKYTKERLLRKIITHNIMANERNNAERALAIWRTKVNMKDCLDKAVKEGEDRVEKISTISKQLLVLSNLTSICESALKLHKVAGIAALKRLLLQSNHGPCKIAAALTQNILKKEMARNALLRLNINSAGMEKEQYKEQLKRFASQSIIELLGRKVYGQAFTFVNALAKDARDTERFTEKVVSFSHFLTRKLSSQFSYFRSSVLYKELSQSGAQNNALQERYEQLVVNYERNMIEAEHMPELRAENEAYLAKVAELENENLELKNMKAELASKNSRAAKEREILIGQIRELETQLATRVKSPTNVSFSGSFKDKSMAKYEETILELNKATSERVLLNTKLAEKEDEVLRLSRIRRELEELVQENSEKASQYRSEVIRSQSESEALRQENSMLRTDVEALSRKCEALQQTLNKQHEELSNIEAERHKFETMADKASKIPLLEAEIEEKRKSAVSLANTIDGLANDKQQLLEQLEKCMQDITLLRDNFTKQQEVASLLKEQSVAQEEEIRQLQAQGIDSATQYKTRINLLENENQELKDFLRKTKSNKRTPAKKVQSTETKQIIDQLKENSQRLQKSLLEKNEQIDKLKQHVAELTKELVDSSRTIAEQQSRLKEVEDKLRKLSNEKNKIQEKLGIVEQEAMLHRKETETMLQTRQASKMEKSALEATNTKLKSEVARLEQEVKALKQERIGVAEYNKLKAEYTGVQQKVLRYDEEVTVLQRRLKEAELERDRCKRDVEEYKRLLEQRKSDIQKFHIEMENYAKILETLEKNMERVQFEKERAEKERAKAVEEINAIRKRYMNILGVEALPGDTQICQLYTSPCIIIIGLKYVQLHMSLIKNSNNYLQQPFFGTGAVVFACSANAIFCSYLNVLLGFCGISAPSSPGNIEASLLNIWFTFVPSLADVSQNSSPSSLANFSPSSGETCLLSAKSDLFPTSISLTCSCVNCFKSATHCFTEPNEALSIYFNLSGKYQQHRRRQWPQHSHTRSEV
eukprot:TRINITY_DN2573_c3_g1_i1.p1 TRINITY_DN2573_c3_g1~~TRINITY_DN2573_c3_g1_i1.p1  ORF type:complete len:1500 (-),score=200.43 TRINITY_DN2573_c3_g1_i1:5896-10395(-)